MSHIKTRDKDSSRQRLNLRLTKKADRGTSWEKILGGHVEEQAGAR